VSTAAGEEIIGRSAEVALLAGFVDSVEGGPAALLLEGEPGIGKTKLCESAVEFARGRSYELLACRPSVSEAQLSFAALGDLVDPVRERVFPELLVPQREALEVALLLSSSHGPPPDRRAIGLAFLGVLRVVARVRPVLLLVDDVQWLDSPSAGVLEFALRRLEGEPLAILLARRANTSPAVPLGVDRALPEGRLGRISVGPLSLGAIHRLIRSRLGVALPRPTLVRVHETSGGNPFYALEIARALERHGGVEPAAPLPLPENLRELVHARLTSLPADVRELLLVVAALSRPTIHTLDAVLGDPDEVESALEKSAQAGLIDVREERIGFTHPLFASVLYAETAPRRRRRLHRQLGEFVRDPEERARHLALGLVKPDSAVASVVEEGAERARARGAPGAAAELAEHVVRLTPLESASELRRRRLAAADHHFTAGNVPRARALLEDALAASPPGRERAEVLAQLATLCGESEGSLAALEVGRAALAEADGDVRLEAEINVTLAFSAQVAESLEAADAYARAAVERAERLGDPSLLAACLATEGFVDFWLGRGLQQEKMERALALERSCGRVWTDVSPSALLGMELSWVGELSGSRALLEGARDRARNDGDASEAVALYYLTFLELTAGDWNRAAQYAAEAYEIAAESGRNAAGYAGAQAVVAAHLGQADATRRYADEAIGIAGQPVLAQLGRWALGQLDLALGRPAAAVRHLQPATCFNRRLGAEEPAVLFWFPLEVEALIEVGKPEEAEALLDWVEERALRLDRAWALATAHRGHGLLAAARGDFASAFAAFERSLAEHERVPQPFELACTQLGLGRVQRRAKQKRAARESLESALAVFEQLGARLWAERTQAELGRIGGRASVSSGLTASEERVAVLVAEGKTNREVAAALYVSERTVEGHLSRIYRKLEIRSRTELTRRLTVRSS
jgi:DNA-binding CsgD family transcriptional regulator